jgi:hypothetical protein
VYAGVQQMLYQAVDYFDRQIADIIFVVFLWFYDIYDISSYA